MHKIQHAPSRFNSLNAALIVPQTLVRKKMKGRRLLCFCISIAPLVLHRFPDSSILLLGRWFSMLLLHSLGSQFFLQPLSVKAAGLQASILKGSISNWVGVFGWRTFCIISPISWDRGKRWKQRGVKRWWETRGAAILRFLVSSCFLLSRLVKLVMAFLCSLLLRNLSLPAEHFAN